MQVGTKVAQGFLHPSVGKEIRTDAEQTCSSAILLRVWYSKYKTPPGFVKTQRQIVIIKPEKCLIFKKRNKSTLLERRWGGN
jgi:hypothetical protein